MNRNDELLSSIRVIDEKIQKFAGKNEVERLKDSIRKIKENLKTDNIIIQNKTYNTDTIKTKNNEEKRKEEENRKYAVEKKHTVNK